MHPSYFLVVVHFTFSILRTYIIYIYIYRANGTGKRFRAPPQEAKNTHKKKRRRRNRLRAERQAQRSDILLIPVSPTTPSDSCIGDHVCACVPVCAVVTPSLRDQA